MSKYRVVADSKRNVRRFVRVKKNGTFTYSKRSGTRRNMSRNEARRAVAWATGKGRKARLISKGSYSHLELSPGAQWPGKALCKRLNKVGVQLNRRVLIRSGDRTPYQAWTLRQRYLAGAGNLAALCCGISGRHSWSQCGRAPRSNHARGRAADCGILTAPNGTYRSIGLVSKARRVMRSLGLCLPVGAGEVWHVEIGTTWRS